MKQKIKSNEVDLPQIKEISNVWSFNKDGKVYDSEMTNKDMRK